ncbi:MAG TPA: nuclear transport factor 2 family protein [Candidatus Nanopelagicales bacterium]|jgi:hypothetical protein
MTHPVRTAIEARDIDALAALLAEDVVFNSPVAFHPFVGRATVTEVLRNVMEVFTDFGYVDELVGNGTHALIFSAGVGGRTVLGLDHLRFDADGLVSEFTVMVRPLSGVIALAEAMGPRVAHLAKG